MDDWDELWDFGYSIGTFPRPSKTQVVREDQRLPEYEKYDIQFARVVKLDDGKPSHSLVLEQSSRAPMNAKQDGNAQTNGRGNGATASAAGEQSTFQPLYYESSPTSGQPSKPSDAVRLAMELTIATNAGGQGSCWMGAHDQAPGKLHKYTTWRNLWTSTGQENLLKSSTKSTIKSIWSCRCETEGPEKGHVVVSGFQCYFYPLGHV